MKDPLGDQMKQFEGIESDRRAAKGMPLCARLDGRAFHSFTASLERPYDARLTKLMEDTTKHLVDETQALLGYTQSDEISLVWFLPETHVGQYLFDGRYQKLASILSAYATGFFVHALENDAIPEKKGQIPLFDCRVWQVPSLWDAYLTFVWRERDAVKNSITMAASAHFSHKQLQGVSGEQKRKMLKEIGHPWETMPMFFRRGTYVQRVKTTRELTQDEMACIPEKHRPHGPVERTETQVVSLPELADRPPNPLEMFFPSVPDRFRIKRSMKQSTYDHELV